MLSCRRYIERNPVEAGLVREPWSYRWSSARAYASGEGDERLSSNRWYEDLGRTPRQRQQKWRQFLQAADPRHSSTHPLS